MTFAQFSSYLQTIESTTLRNSITAILAGLFQDLTPQEVEPACWLLLGRIVPPYEGIEFQFAEKMLIRALARVVGSEVDEVTKHYKQVGDLATVAEQLVGSRHLESVSALSVSDVYTKLATLAREAGEGSQERKVQHVIDLLKVLDPLSVRFVVRILLTKLRLGFSDMTMLDALSWAVHGDKRARKELEDAYQMKNDIGKLASTFLSHKEAGLSSFTIELGIPIQPALCQRLKTAQEMIEKMGKLYAEAKYDGTRVQIHVKKSGSSWRVRTFTRSMEESSHMFPELVSNVAAFGDHELILDCEAIGFDQETGKLLPFQETIQRKRKHDVGLFSEKIPLRFFIFDVLFLDGKPLLSVPLHERKAILHSLFSEGLAKASIFIESGFIITEDANELRAFHKKQLDEGLEGAVIKKYDSVYQPGRRGWSWVKFKEVEDSEAKLSDTIDAVVMGYWYGKGKRTTFGMGAFLIGVSGSDEKIVTLSKVGTGLTDDQWKEMVMRCSSNITATMPSRYVVDKALRPDVWVDPTIVVEVAGDELTRSPNHSAGLALRFPRLIRFRDDKTLLQITTSSELQSIR